MAANDIKELALCHVIKGGNNILLIRSDEGINKGKWNAPNAEIAQGESPVKAAMRSVFQQTGLYVTKATFHGNIRLFLNGKNEYSYRLHLFSTKLFSGDLKPNMKGEGRWFNTSDIPYYEMWADDKYWLNLVLEGKEFDADFFFDEKNENIVKYQIKEKQKVVQKYIVPVIVVALIIGVAAFGVMNLGKTNLFSTTIKPQPLVPTPNTPTTSSTSTTTIRPPNTTTTTIPITVPIKISINNIDMSYNYTGPTEIGSTLCNQPSKSGIIYYNRIINSSSWLMNTTIGTYGCNLTITRIYTTTPGFHIINITPNPPLSIPAYSTTYFDFIVTTTNKSFVGPLSITMNDR